MQAYFFWLNFICSFVDFIVIVFLRLKGTAFFVILPCQMSAGIYCRALSGWMGKRITQYLDVIFVALFPLVNSLLFLLLIDSGFESGFSGHCISFGEGIWGNGGGEKCWRWD